MKSKKLLLVIGLFAAVVIGWMMTLRAVNQTEEKEAQRNLVAEADAFMERGLYVRAIPLYEEALVFETEFSPEVQLKLMQALEGNGDNVAYIALVNVRLLAQLATEDECLKAANMLIEQGTYYLDEALPILEAGMEYIDSAAMKELYEKHRYTYISLTTSFENILPSDNGIYPMYKEGKWGYCSDKGKLVLAPSYDKVTNFNDAGYAVVQKDGTYYTILEDGDRYGADDGTSYDKMTDIKCVTATDVLGQRNGTYSFYGYDFEPKTTGDTYQFTDMSGLSCNLLAVKKDKWGVITNGGEVVVENIYEDVAINSTGNAFAGDRAMVKENGKWHMIDTAGNTIGAETYADAKAPEDDGLVAVANAEGKWGFIDLQGNLVIPYQYADAKSFSDELGAVYDGRVWGFISKDNVMAVEMIYDEVHPFRNGVAIVKLGTNMNLLKLEYYPE